MWFLSTVFLHVLSLLWKKENAVSNHLSCSLECLILVFYYFVYFVNNDDMPVMSVTKVFLISQDSFIFSCSVVLSLSHFLHSLYDCFIFALNWLAFVWVDASGCCHLVPFAYDSVVGSSSHLPAEMLFLTESLVWSHVYSQELYRHWSSVVWQGLLLWNSWPKEWLPFLTPVPWHIVRAWQCISQLWLWNKYHILGAYKTEICFLPVLEATSPRSRYLAGIGFSWGLSPRLVDGCLLPSVRPEISASPLTSSCLLRLWWCSFSPDLNLWVLLSFHF